MDRFSATGTFELDSNNSASIAEQIIVQCSKGLLMFNMERINAIARQRNWKLHGQQALYKYFAEKYHWLPSQVRTLSTEEIAALLEGEP